MDNSELLRYINKPIDSKDRKAITCNTETHRVIKEIAKDTKSTVNQIVNALLDFYLDTEIVHLDEIR
jgi:hypothetical protein